MKFLTAVLMLPVLLIYAVLTLPFVLMAGLFGRKLGWKVAKLVVKPVQPYNDWLERGKK